MNKVATTLNLEEEALGLLSTIVDVFPLSEISDELISFTKTIFLRMHMYKNKTRLKRIPEVFLKSFLVFSAKFMLRHGSEAFISLTNQVQDGILINLLEKEGACIGRFNKSEVYRRHIIAAYTLLIAEAKELVGTNAMVTIVQGLIENICPTGKFDKETVNKEDFTEDLPAEYQEDTANFDRTSFQQLYSIIDATEKFTGNSNLPNVENYTLYVLQCIEVVVKRESSSFIQKVGDKLTKDTKEYFGELLNHFRISLD